MTDFTAPFDAAARAAARRGRLRTTPAQPRNAMQKALHDAMAGVKPQADQAARRWRNRAAEVNDDEKTVVIKKPFNPLNPFSWI